MIKFEKPEYKITEYIESNHFGKFEIDPLERGFGTTIGNALRRVLLSSLPGSAITSIKIDGVLHEFQKIEGVREDVTSIVLAMKSLVVKNHSEGKKVLRLSAKNEGPVTAGMIEKDADVEIINPDLVICNLVKGGKIDIEMTVENGRGYVDAATNKKNFDNEAVGTIAIDSAYSPIELVKYEVVDTRVGQNENYDKLIMEITTNGSMSPEEAIALAAKILVEHFSLLTDLNAIADFSGLMQEKKVDTMTKTLETPIEEVEFSVRAYNCLKRAGIHTVQDLVNKMYGTLLITSSRRTSDECIKKIRQKVNCDYFFYDWKWENDPNNMKKNQLGNPYFALLGLSNFLIVTGDSMSMVSEACSTGKPSYVYMPKKSLSKKHLRFLKALMKDGYIKEFSKDTKNLEKYNYRELNELERVADIIEEKIKERK